jgi:predicted RNA-binding protein with PIN domain
MAFILIDGYNLIGIAHRDLEGARHNLIEALSQYSDMRGHKITLVFDGWKNGQATETRQRIGNINVIYSRIGENADFVIKRILNESTRMWIVVSSDREISDFAERKNSVPIPADEFEKRMYKSLYDSGNAMTEALYDYEKDEESLSERFLKGNPRKLSKKQKKKLRAMEKL